MISASDAPSNLDDVNNWLGRSNWAGDSNTDATYNEFRIYDYALNDAQVQRNLIDGPNTLTIVPEPSAAMLGLVGLGRGVLQHGFMLPSAIASLGLGVMAGALAVGHEGGELLYSVIGVLILALGHDLTRRAVI